MATETLGRGMTDRDYVEYMLDVKDGQVIGCEYHGEGQQVEPLTESVVYVPVPDITYPRGFRLVERRIKSALRKLCR